MANKDELTPAEFEKYRLHPVVLEHIEKCRARLDIPRHQFRIADWGCGRGKLVLWLLEQGYQAVGVDLHDAPFARSVELFRSKGYPPQDYLRRLDERGISDFAEGSFHFIVSWQTLEHIRDFAATAAEWRRVTIAGGAGFHFYTAHRKLVEPHLYMPLVHWLPKNETRRWLIGLFVLLGVEPNWWPQKRVDWRIRTQEYFDYSVGRTYYRSPKDLRRVLTACGLGAEFVDVTSWKPARQWLSKLPGLGSSSPLIRIWVLNFGGNLGLATSLQDRNSGSLS